MSDIARKSVESHDKSDHIKSSGFLPFPPLSSRPELPVPVEKYQSNMLKSQANPFYNTRWTVDFVAGLQSVVIVIAPEQQNLFETFIHTDIVLFRSQYSRRNRDEYKCLQWLKGLTLYKK